MSERGARLLLSAMALSLGLALSCRDAHAAKSPPKPAPLLGSHPSIANKNARLALTKGRSTFIPLHITRQPKLANSLNPRAGKTVTVGRKPPK